MKVIWHKRLMEILGWPAMAIGAATTTVAVTNASTDQDEGGWLGQSSDLDSVVLPNTLNATAEDLYAAHRSHSSHGSHRSHRSGSGSGGTVTPSPSIKTVPAPVPTPTPVPVPVEPAPVPSVTTVPMTPEVQPSTIPKPAPQDLSMMVVRVQAALMRLGYYNGNIDGLLAEPTRSALKAYQKAQGVPQTGRIDLATLTKLGISIP